MDIIKERILDLVKVEGISSIQYMANELGIDEFEIRSLLMDLKSEGRIDGLYSSDYSRFYLTQIETSDKLIRREDYFITTEPKRAFSSRQKCQMVEIHSSCDFDCLRCF